MGKKPFNVIFENLNYSGNLFMPLREINQLRRDLIDSVENKLIQSYLPSPDELKSSFEEYNECKRRTKILGGRIKELKSIKKFRKK